MNRVALAAFFACAVVTGPAYADLVVERIVARVDDQVIGLRELREHAKADVARIMGADLPPEDKERRVADAIRDHLTQLVDDALVAHAAAAAGLALPPGAVDALLAGMAEAEHVPVSDVLARQAKRGIDERTYRTTLERIVLRRMLVARRLTGRVAPGVKVSEERATREEKAMLAELRAGAYVEERL